MTNREKYPKTEDAVAAYHEEHYCGSFVKWLNQEAREAPGGIECPVCHGTHGAVHDLMFITMFMCPDCRAHISFDDIEDPTEVKLRICSAKHRES